MEKIINWKKSHALVQNLNPMKMNGGGKIGRLRLKFYYKLEIVVVMSLKSYGCLGLLLCLEILPMPCIVLLKSALSLYC